MAVLLAGCGTTGASDQEVREAENKAFTEGQEVGERKGESAVEDANASRIAQARENGYWEGWDEGYEEGEESAYELGEELDEEEREELREQFGLPGEEGSINPEPRNQYGEPSQEFEPDDIERAEEADQELREYCEGAVSEAQEVGCLAHADPP